jgi:hypothetical protein
MLAGMFNHNPRWKRRKVLTSAGGTLDSPNLDGVVAQLVEHHNGIVGVAGSNPVGSTSLRSKLKTFGHGKIKPTKSFDFVGFQKIGCGGRI